MQSLLGNDLQPRGTVQVVAAAIGNFLGAIINANIFGELAVILASMGQVEKIFQSKLAMINTAMINLKLPQKIQQNIRDSLIRNQPSLESLEQMEEFLKVISPSIKFKVLRKQYFHVL